MKKVISEFNSKMFISFILLFCINTAGFTQTVTMSTANCVATTNEFQFDVLVTNTGTVDIQFNNTVIRFTHSAAIIAGGTNTIVFSYLGDSDFPLSWPPNSSPTFTYNAGTRLFGVATSPGIYSNGTTCAAPNIPAGQIKKLGRFSLKNTAQNFVSEADVGLTWNTTSSVTGYLNCAQGTTGFNNANGNRTLSAPCSLTIQATCTSPTVNSSPTDQVTCASDNTGFTGSFTGGTPAPTLVWQVQSGGVGVFTDLSEAAPYSNTTTNTLTVTAPGTALNGNRYRLKANNTCGDVFTADALLTVNPAANAGTVSGTLSTCAGSVTTFSNNGDAGGAWSSSNTAVATVNASNGIVSALSAGSTDITYTVFSGCVIPATSFSTLTITGSGTLAGTTGGARICSNATISSSASQPSGTSFSDGSCNVIATVLPSGLVPVSGNINTCVTIDDQVRTYQTRPYVQRHYDIMPETNGANATATVTLYFTQAEFDAFNVSRGLYPRLPNGGGDLTGIENLLVTQYHGVGINPGTYDGGVVDLINPDDSKIIFNNSLNRWEITFNVNGFSGFYVHTSLNNTPLPVNLVSFSGRNNGNVNLLEWATSSEQHSSHFELERSLDGFSFEKAGTIAAVGNSSLETKYSFNDDIRTINARLFYYRLKQVDLSGQFKYSPIVTIKLDRKGFFVEATPNPFADHIRVQIEAIQKEKATITINNMAGKRISQQFTSLNKGSNVIMLNNLDHLPGGVYLLTVITDTEKATLKVVKQR